MPRRASARGLVRPGPVRPIPLSVTLGRITTYVASRRSLQFTRGHRIERERCKSAHFSAGPGQPPPSADARVRARLVPLSAAAAEAEDRAEAAERRATADGEVSPRSSHPPNTRASASLPPRSGREEGLWCWVFTTGPARATARVPGLPPHARPRRITRHRHDTPSSHQTPSTNSLPAGRHAAPRNRTLGC